MNPDTSTRPQKAHSGGIERVTVATAEAAQMLGVGKTKLFQLIANREIRTILIGRKRLVRVDSIHDFVERQSVLWE